MSDKRQFPAKKHARPNPKGTAPKALGPGVTDKNVCNSSTTVTDQPATRNGGISVQAIFDETLATETEILTYMREEALKKARQNRAEETWKRVSTCRGDALPRGLKHGEYLPLYVQQIMELGKVLQADGWQERLDCVTPDSKAKRVALEILNRAMAGDYKAVEDLVRRCVSTLLTLGLNADQWLRDGLRYEVLGIPPEEDSVFFQEVKPVELAEEELALPTESLPKPAATKKRASKIEARDRWIYKQCCAGVHYKEIKTELKKIAADKGWGLIASPQGVQEAGRRYAENHHKPYPPSRQNQ